MSWLESWYEDNVSGKDGEYKGRGFGAAILKPFVDEQSIEDRVQGNRNKQTATSLGYDLSELDVAPGATTLDVQGAAIRRGKKDKRDEKDSDREFSLKPLEMQMEENREQRAAELQQATAQRDAEMRLAREKLAQTNNLTLLQLGQQNDQKIAELQYQKMRDRKTDMQYNERMEMLDRRDRRTAMQNMAAGLASLGAAFAL